LKKKQRAEEEGGTKGPHRPSSSPPKEKPTRDTNQPTATTTEDAPAQIQFRILRKRKRGAMGYNNITIHEDDTARIQQLHDSVPEHLIMAEHDPNMQFSDDDDDDSEEEVDETVAEDMLKLEENFKGISQKYRLINRIGEGMLV